MSDRLIDPKTLDQILEYFEPVLDSLGTVLGGRVIIYGINLWNRCLVSGLPTDSPLPV